MKPRPKENGKEGLVFIHVGQADYFKQVTRSKFILSPPGINSIFGENCEALMRTPFRKW